MNSAAPIASLLTLLAGAAHAQIDIPVPSQEAARVLADAGVVQATLPEAWGQLRTDVKGGNPMQMVVRGGGSLWRPDTVQSLDVPAGTVPTETPIAVEINGVPVTLRLRPLPLQAQDPLVMIEMPDGTLQHFQQLPSNLYSGEVDGFAGSSVSASFRNGKLRALVQLAPGLAWEIQPLSDLTTGGDPTLHMTWDASTSLPGPPVRCGVEHGHDHEPSDDDHGVAPPATIADDHAGHTQTVRIDQLADEGIDHGGGGSGGGWSERTTGDALLAIDVDCYLYDNYNNVQDTVDFVYEVIGAANSRYRQQLGFEHRVTYILVRVSCATDPYETSNPDDAEQILYRMRDTVWNASNPVPRDIAMLFTGRDLDSFIAGRAFDGGACGDLSGGQALIEADNSPQSQVRYTLAKHELGHSWDARHTCGSFGTSGYCSIMCADVDEISCGFSDTDFLPLSISQINAFRATATCITHEGDTWYVDATNPYAYPNGNQNHPFTTFMEAYNAAAAGQTVFVRGHGASNQYVNGFTRLTRPMTIDGTSLNGPARIR